ncbi:MAG: oligosaccharide flippase family protein [Sphingobacteriales bacterium]|nr:oligosaccharide flippase family protein [Sphingobacteriales bacterium]
MRFLLKGFAFRVIYMAAVSLANLVIAKIAGTTEFGLISMLVVNAALIQIITGLGTDSAIVWHGITGKQEEKNKIYSLTIYASLLQLFLFTAAAVIFFRSTGKTILSGADRSGYFYIELGYFAGLILTDKFTSLFYSQQSGVFCNKLLGGTVSALFTIFLIFILTNPVLTPAIPAIILCIFMLVPAIVLILVYQFSYKPRLERPGKSSLGSFASFSFIVLVTNLVQFVAYRADYWFINYYHSKPDVGIYAQASKFMQMLWIMPVILAGFIVPALKNRDNKMSVAQLVTVSRLLFFSHIILGILIAAGSYLVYQFFLPVDFSNGFESLLIMMPGYLLFIFPTVLAAYFSANRMLKINLAGSVICFAIILIADLLLIPRYSFKGAALANLISYSLTSIFFLVMIKYKEDISLKSFFVLNRRDFKNLFSGFRGTGNESEK